MNSKNFQEELLGINCAYSYKEESRDHKTTETRCYSTECMLNAHADVAHSIHKRGCVIFREMPEAIKRIKELKDKRKPSIDLVPLSLEPMQFYLRPNPMVFCLPIPLANGMLKPVIAYVGKQ